jgi:hypothetical protein
MILSEANKRRRKQRESRRRTAIHEAAHAVIGRVLRQVCEHATIERDEAEGEGGHAIIAAPWTTATAWWETGRLREHETIMRGRIMSYMAGAVAEGLLGGGHVGSDKDDRRQIACMLDDLFGSDGEAIVRWEQRLRRHTHDLVRRHAEKIKLVAGSLVLHSRLEADQIDALMGPVSLSEAKAERDLLLQRILEKFPHLTRDEAILHANALELMQ